MDLVVARIFGKGEGIVIQFVAYPNFGVNPPYVEDFFLKNTVGRCFLQNPSNEGVIINYRDQTIPLEVSIEDQALIDQGVNEKIEFTYADGTTETVDNNAAMANAFKKLLNIV